MTKIAILLRLLQLFAHNAHNMASGPTFFADHEHLGELYPQYEEQYDSVIERMIGLDDSLNLTMITMQAAQGSSTMSLAQPFQELVEAEDLLREEINIYLAEGHCAEGTRQLLGEIANQSEARQYKLRQRIKNG